MNDKHIELRLLDESQLEFKKAMELATALETGDKNSWGGQGVGAWENRGREGYGRQEREGRKVGDLRGREAGEKCETLFF